MPDRSHSYLPQRIIGGSLKPEGLELSLREKKDVIPWEKIRLLCLGIVEEPLLESPSSLYLQMKEAVKNLFSRERKDEDTGKRLRLYLEIFTSDQEQPFRIESTSINYRSFIEEVEYVSENNFRKFLRKLIERTPDCVLDESVHAFLANQKSNIRRFGNIYEFQRGCQERWLKQKENP